jgi:alkane 1-monooxygenase
MARAYLHSSLPYYLGSVIVFLFMYLTEFHHRPFLIFVIIYALIPVIDLILPDDNLNPTPEEEKLLSSQLKWKVPVYLYVLAEWACLFWGFSYLVRHTLTASEYFVLILAIGHVGAIGFLFSHELFHKRDLPGQVIGTLNMLKSLYMHFYSEHLLGHHKYVSTPQDPATAKYNQSLYGFIFQTVTGSFVNTWNREKKRAVKRKLSPYGFGNRMMQWLALEAAFTAAIGVGLGTRCLGYFLGQAICASTMLEVINYIRHYGLQRKKLANGEYEPVTPKHSWNAPQTLQNMILLKLQRHSDHHANAYKPYQILKSYLDSPNLPCGYAVCILASLFPPFWFSIVNPLADGTNQSGKPSDRQMSESTKSLRLWLLLQVSSMVALSFVFN